MNNILIKCYVELYEAYCNTLSEVLMAGENEIHVNIYADEVQGKKCPYTGDSWDYIGLIAEDLSKPLLDEIIKTRYKENFDSNSKYYEKTTGSYTGVRLEMQMRKISADAGLNTCWIRIKAAAGYTLTPLV